MSIIDEFAILGYSIKDKKIREQALYRLSPNHFTDERTKDLFRMIFEMVEDGVEPTASNILQLLDEGQGLLTSCWRAMNDSDNAEEVFQALENEWMRQSYIQVANMLLELANSENFSVDQAESIVNAFMPYKDSRSNPDYMITAETAAAEAMESLKEAMKNPGQIKGLSMSYQTDGGGKAGFKMLDDAMNGLEPGTLTIFAAKSGHGKTALAMNIARILSYHNDKRVYYLNTEMNVVQMVNRWIAMATMIPYEKISRGDITSSEFERIEEWNAKFSKSPLLVSRIPALTMDLVKALTKMAVRKHGKLDALIVDYIGRMDISNTRNMQEYQILSQIAKYLKEFASDQKIPVITLSQLNEEGKLEGAKKIRNECDGLFFFQPKTIEVTGSDGKTIEMPSQTDYMLIKEKVRNGSTDGIIHCEFDKPYQFIREV